MTNSATRMVSRTASYETAPTHYQPRQPRLLQWETTKWVREQTTELINELCMMQACKKVNG